MGQLLWELLPLTILSALTPWTIVGVIVLLASSGGVRTAVAFTLGWFTAILALGSVIVLGLIRGHVEHTRSATWIQIGLQLGFGLALLVFAHRRWKRRPASGVAVTEPGWLRRLDRIGAPLAFVFGAAWINGFLVVPAALQIGRADVTGAEKALALVIYALGASSGQIAVIGYRVLSPARASGSLARLRGWVSRNSAVTISVVLAIIGGGLLLKALVGAIQL